MVTDLLCDNECRLLVSNILKFAEEHHGKTEIVSKTVEGPIHRYTYADAAARSRQLANVLVSLGIGAGDTVTTIAWNGFRYIVDDVFPVLFSTRPFLHGV